MRLFLQNLLLWALPFASLTAQVPSNYWQQNVEYQIDIRLDDLSHAVQGRAKIKYFNHSPDTLKRVFFHLYWNAIQPNSAYAQWAKRTKDVMTSDRLFALKPTEIGRMDIFTVQQNGVAIDYRVNETVMEATLSRPLNPGDFDVIEVAWQGQVPLCIRRGGRNNSAGVAYSFTQWYPKICAYDRFGWHPDPYDTGKEFFGEYGSFKVDITLPKKYMVAATGVLQNAQTIGFGYEGEGVTVKPNYGLVNTWKFQGDHIHDFAWAADPGYVHEKTQVREGLVFHYFYKPGETITPAWKSLRTYVEKSLPFIEANFGPYLYPQFSFVQGGQWSMEYPMMTLLENPSTEDPGTESTAVHEFLHSWYYAALGSNENDHPWLDEGFTSYATAVVDALHAPDEATAHAKRNAASLGVVKWQKSVTEPMNTPANLSESTDAYNFNAYVKGASYLWHLRYIVGEEAFTAAMLKYHAHWHFKHPSPDDFLREMERAAGMELDWFQSYWLNTVKTLDYAVANVAAKGSTATTISLKRPGEIAVPVEILLKFQDGSTERHYIPVDYQYGSKKFPAEWKVVSHPPWGFAVDTYEITLARPLTELQSVTIDPEEMTADANRADNIYHARH